MKKILILFAVAILQLQAFSQPWDFRTIDISTMAAIDSVIYDVKFTSELGLQIVFRGVTGATDGSFNLFVGHADTTAVSGIVSTLLPYTISSADEVVPFEKTILAFSKLKIKFTKNGMTGGFIDIYFRTKRRY